MLTRCRCYFPGFLVGPYLTYNDYQALVTGSLYKSAEEKEEEKGSGGTLVTYYRIDREQLAYLEAGLDSLLARMERMERRLEALNEGFRWSMERERRRARVDQGWLERLPQVMESLSRRDPEEVVIDEGRWSPGESEEREEYLPEDEEEEDEEEGSAGEETE